MAKRIEFDVLVEEAKMKRFIPSSVYETSLEKTGFTSFLLDSLQDLLNQLRADLYPAKDKANVFKL
ncbi:MAG: hypothetical protein WAK61_20725 [Leclercia sp.]